MATKKRLIEVETVIEKIRKANCADCYSCNGVLCRACLVDDFISLLEDSPKVDAVSRGVHDQVRWERDVAIEQLESYGVSLGEKAEVAKVVHGRWRFCGSDRWNDDYECSNCGKMAMCDSNYCPNCGAKMDGGKDNG